jgi:hypothetical protein
MKLSVFLVGYTYVHEYICTHEHAHVHILSLVCGCMVGAEVAAAPVCMQASSTGTGVTRRTVSGDRSLGQTCHKCLRQISEWSMWPFLVLCRLEVPLHINCYIKACLIKRLYSLELMNFQTNWPYLSPSCGTIS